MFQKQVPDISDLHIFVPVVWLSFPFLMVFFWNKMSAFRKLPVSIARKSH